MPTPTDPTIIIMMHDKLLLQNCVDILELESFQVLAASTVEAGMQFIRDTDPVHLVLLELVMPDLNTVAFVQTAKSLKQPVSLPFIIMQRIPTRYPEYAKLQPLIVEWLLPPFTVQQLVAAVNDGIRQAHGDSKP